MLRISTLVAFLFLSVSVWCQDAMDLVITDINGDKHSLENALDQDYIVLVDFFNINCPVCNGNAPFVEFIHEDYTLAGKNVVIFRISSWNNSSEVSTYAASKGYSGIFIGNDKGGSDAKTAFANEFGGFVGYPTYGIFYPDGTYDWQITGSGQALENKFRSLIDGYGTKDAPAYQSISTTSTHDQHIFDGTITIGPNPANDYINIQLTSGKILEGRVDVINALGQTVLSEQIGYIDQNIYHRMELNDVNRGTYFVRVTDRLGHQLIRQIRKS